MKHGQNRFNPLARSNGEEDLKLNILVGLANVTLYHYHIR